MSDFPIDPTPEPIAEWLARHPEYVESTPLSDLLFGAVPGIGNVSASVTIEAAKQGVKIVRFD